jgi:sulfofructose kinase
VYSRDVGLRAAFPATTGRYTAIMAATTPPQWDVIGVGANSVDHVYRIPAAPAVEGPASKMRITSHVVSCGGQMATALAACARFGLRTKYIGVVGSDGNGRLVRDELGRRGIDATHVVVRGGATRFAVILVPDGSGERIVLWHRDEHAVLRAEELSADLLHSTRIVHVDDEDQDAAMTAARRARDAGVQVTSDIDRLTDRTEELVAAVTIPILAEHVPEALTGESDPERALRRLRAGPDGMLCVTLGARGAMLLDGDTLHAAPAVPVTAVDTTGAGDVFRGAFIYALLQGWPPPDLLRFANTAAALSCTRPGAMASVPSLDEVTTAMPHVVSSQWPASQ